jgi:predicted ArsR family transcriptional regulator
VNDSAEVTSNAVMCECSLPLTEVLDLLKKHGERLDSKIAEEIGIPLETVRQRLSRLAAGLVVTCNFTRYKDGERVDGRLCRISGFIPPAACGRKPAP